MKCDNIPTLFLAVLLGLEAASGSLVCQQSKPTVRHHRVEETVPDDTSSPEIDQAETAMQKGDFAAAEALLQKAIAAKPGNYRAWFDLGYVYNATQRTPEAIDAYRKAVTAKADVFESNLNLGLLLAKQNDTEEAARYLKSATQLKPAANPEQGLTRAWMALGQLEQGSDPQFAIVAYGQAAKLSPKDAAPHLAAAGLLQVQKNWDAAVLEYRAAAEADPASKDALLGVASTYIQQKKYSDAEATLRKLLADDPQNTQAHLQLGRVLAVQGKNEEAAHELQAGQPDKAADPHAALELGTLYVRAGKDAEAERQFRLALEKLPRDADAHFSLGSVLMHEKKYPEAQQELLIAIRLKPDLADAYGNLAVVAAENKNYPITLQALDDRAKYLPEIPATYFLRATTFDELKAVRQAVENYQKFLAVDGGKAPDQEWQARHRLIALDPQHADKYRVKK